MSEYIVDYRWLRSRIFGQVEHLTDGLTEIVRCRDCRYSNEDRRCTSIGWVSVLVCECEQWSTSGLMPSHTVEADGFCKWGERRVGK